MTRSATSISHARNAVRSRHIFNSPFSWQGDVIGRWRDRAEPASKSQAFELAARSHLGQQRDFAGSHNTSLYDRIYRCLLLPLGDARTLAREKQLGDLSKTFLQVTNRAEFQARQTGKCLRRMGCRETTSQVLAQESHLQCFLSQAENARLRSGLRQVLLPFAMDLA